MLSFALHSYTAIIGFSFLFLGGGEGRGSARLPGGGERAGGPGSGQLLLSQSSSDLLACELISERVRIAVRFSSGECGVTSHGRDRTRGTRCPAKRVISPKVDQCAPLLLNCGSDSLFRSPPSSKLFSYPPPSATAKKSCAWPGPDSNPRLSEPVQKECSDGFLLPGRFISCSCTCCFYRAWPPNALVRSHRRVD